jgi:hypothetical protein
MPDLTSTEKSQDRCSADFDIDKDHDCDPDLSDLELMTFCLPYSELTNS